MACEDVREQPRIQDPRKGEKLVYSGCPSGCGARQRSYAASASSTKTAISPGWRVSMDVVQLHRVDTNATDVGAADPPDLVEAAQDFTHGKVPCAKPSAQ
jgi:hypothetical protein